MMNKSVFIAAALALAVVGCGDNKQAQDAKAAADKAAQAAKDSADKAAAAAKDAGTAAVQAGTAAVDATKSAGAAAVDATKSASDAALGSAEKVRFLSAEEKAGPFDRPAPSRSSRAWSLCRRSQSNERLARARRRSPVRSECVAPLC